MTERVLHCWEGGPTCEDDTGTTCMLLAGHDGEHLWTRDDEVTVRFVGKVLEDNDEDS